MISGRLIGRFKNFVRLLRSIKVGLFLRRSAGRVARVFEPVNPLSWVFGRPPTSERVEHIWPPQNFSARSAILWRLLDEPLARRGVFQPQIPRSGKLRFTTFHDEHLIIASALKSISVRPEDCFFVDIGAGDGIDMSNTFLLAEQEAKGIALEFNPSKFSMMAVTYRALPNIQLARVPVTPRNVVALLEGLGCPKEVTLLNLDIDSYDYDVLESILLSFSFRFLCLEINPIFPFDIEFKVNFPATEWAGDTFHGMSLSMAYRLLRDNGYEITHLDRSFLFATRKDAVANPLQPIPSDRLEATLDQSLVGSSWDQVLKLYRGRPVGDILSSLEDLFAGKPDGAYTMKLSSSKVTKPTL